MPQQITELFVLIVDTGNRDGLYRNGLRVNAHASEDAALDNMATWLQTCVEEETLEEDDGHGESVAAYLRNGQVRAAADLWADLEGRTWQIDRCELSTPDTTDLANRRHALHVIPSERGGGIVDVRIVPGPPLAEVKEDDLEPAECDNCPWTGQVRDTLRPIPDLEHRIDAGGEVPAGECPLCGALAYLARQRGSLARPAEGSVPDAQE